LNDLARKTLGDVGNASFFAGPQLGQADGKPPAELGATFGMVEKPEYTRKADLAKSLKMQMVGGLMNNLLKGPKFDPMSMLANPLAGE
jgi:hypothetical protein